MNLIHKIERWGDTHHPRLLDIVRIALGVFILLKGIAFMHNTSDLQSVIENQSDLSVSPALFVGVVYYVTFVNMVGGTMIALGIYTRIASLMQIPVVFAGLFFASILLSPLNTGFWLSTTCLVLLVIFTVIGSGKASLGNYLDHLNN